MTTRNPHAGLPITDDDATIAAALEDVSIPTLMLSLVHMTGDASLIRGELKPQGLFLNEVQGYMSEPDKAEVRRIALDVIRDVSRRRLRAPAAAEPGARARDDELARLRGRARRVRADDARGDGARRRRRARGRDRRRRRARAPRSPSSSSAAGSRDCSPASGCRRPASRSRSSRRTPTSAARGSRTRIPAVASTSATTSTATRSNRATSGPSTSRKQPEIQSYFADVMHRHGIEPHIRWNTEVVSAHVGRRRRHLGGRGAHAPTARPRRSSPAP